MRPLGAVAAETPSPHPQEHSVAGSGGAPSAAGQQGLDGVAPQAGCPQGEPTA